MYTWNKSVQLWLEMVMIRTTKHLSLNGKFQCDLDDALSIFHRHWFTISTIRLFHLFLFCMKSADRIFLTTCHHPHLDTEHCRKCKRNWCKTHVEQMNWSVIETQCVTVALLCEWVYVCVCVNFDNLSIRKSNKNTLHSLCYAKPEIEREWQCLAALFRYTKLQIH